MTSPAPETSPGLAAVRAWCGWHIAPSKTETVKVEGGGGRVLLLPSLHVTNCTAVRDESGNAVTGWKVRENGIARGSWRDEELYEFDITHGYDQMPAELLGIVADLDSNGVGAVVKSKAIGPFSESYGSDLALQPITTQAIVARYRIPPSP